MKTLAIIQARMSSTRLPGKVLLPFGQTTVLGSVIKRMQRCRNVSAVLVATSINDKDDSIIAETIKHGALYYRGSLYDVLNRYHNAAELYGADMIVRITADCPYIMPDMVDELIEKSTNADYGSNIQRRTYPKGFDCEVFTFGELRRADRSAVGDDREHVTPYMKEHAMQKVSIEGTDNLSDIRVTLDTPEDYVNLIRLLPVLSDVYEYEKALEFFRKERQEFFNSGNLIG